MGHEFLVNHSRDGYALEGPVRNEHLVESARLAFFYEFRARPSFGLDNIGDLGDGSPFFVRTE